jgi:hypothetical protein
MPSALRSAVVLAFVSALAVLSMPGCSQQGIGERCDRAKNGDDDCDSGLSCVAKSELLDKVTDRCCPAVGSGKEDSRCTRATTGSSSSAGSSSGGTGGTSSGTGGTSSDTGGTSSDAGGTPSESEAGGPAASTDAGASSGGAGSGG